MKDRQPNSGSEYANWSPLKDQERTVTPETLLSDNLSFESQKRRNTWEEAKRGHNLTAVWACGDARLIMPHAKSIFIRSIATGGSKEPYGRLLSSDFVKKAVILTHFDSRTVQLGKTPRGCGGLDAKIAEMNGELKGKGIAEFIRNHVSHPDPIVQAWISAEQIAEQTVKPVLAATQDHLTGRIYSVAAFSDGGETVRSKVKMSDILRYNPDNIYKSGIPELEDFKIPEVFHNFLIESRFLAAQNAASYPDLAQRQHIQNQVTTVALSTDPRPFHVRYPDTFRAPGSLFKLAVPRGKKIDGHEIGETHLKDALDQANYPIEHSVQNFGNPEGSFSRVDTVFIETGDIDQSRDLADVLMKRPWMQEWLNLAGKQILVGQTQRGTAQEIAKFR